MFYHFRSDPGGTTSLCPPTSTSETRRTTASTRGWGSSPSRSTSRSPPTRPPALIRAPAPPRSPPCRPSSTWLPSTWTRRSTSTPSRRDPSSGPSRQDARIPSLPDIRPEQSRRLRRQGQPSRHRQPSRARPIEAVQWSSPLRTPNPATGRTSPSRPRPDRRRDLLDARPPPGRPWARRRARPQRVGGRAAPGRSGRHRGRVGRRPGWCDGGAGRLQPTRRVLPAQRRRSAGGPIGDRQRGLAVVAHRPDRATPPSSCVPPGHPIRPSRSP